MSVRALNWAFEQHVNPAEKVILLAIADMANDENQAWPSNAYLMRRTGLSERTIRNHMRMLEHLDLLTTEVRKRENGSQTSNLYTLAVDPPAYSAPPGGKLLPPQEPSLEPDLTKTSQSQSPPIAESGSTDSEVIEVTVMQEKLARNEGITDLRAVVRTIKSWTGYEVTAAAALNISSWILNKAKFRPASPQRYVIATIGRSPLEIQKHIHEQGYAS